ncbi:MAG TPA: hypothetical protein VKY38_01965 [Azoarcus sp.]|nr:hypothetical protein [Azoarcus sp.]
MREPTIAWALRTKQAHQIHDLVSKQSRKHAGFHSVLLRQAFFDSSKSPLKRTSATRQYCNAMQFLKRSKRKVVAQRRARMAHLEDKGGMFVGK